MSIKPKGLSCRYCGERGTTKQTHENYALRLSCSACGIRKFISYELAWERITTALALDELGEETP